MTPQVQELRPPQPPLSMPRGCYLDDSHEVPRLPPWDMAPSRRAEQRDASEVPFGVRRQGVSALPDQASLLSSLSPQCHLPGPAPQPARQPGRGQVGIIRRPWPGRRRQRWQ